MATLLKLKAVAERKGCSKKAVHRACEHDKVNSDFDPVTGEYKVYDDEKLAEWQPGDSGKPPEPEA
ncbi:MAG TPA: hypothetical protein VGK74_13535 [Symbiobacteriaceae bacterium]|jgi:hypothetical protein